MVRDLLKAYGEISLDRIDIRGQQCWLIDLLPETGRPGPDTSRVLDPPHPFTLSVLKPLPGELALGEIVFVLNDREVHLVGQLTGRPLFEVTPDILMAAKADDQYLTRIRQWLGLAAA